MKKQLLLLLMMLLPMVAMAYDAEIDGIYYDFNGTEATVTSGSIRYYGNVVIPQRITYNNLIYDVTTIGFGAFFGCHNLTAITIPEGVIAIESQAFDYCETLTSISIPKSVNKMNGNVFSNCSSLSSITVEEGNTTYDSRNECNAIIETATNKLVTGCKNTIIPNDVTTIGAWAFSCCYDLTSIIIPEGVTSVGRGAFEYCGLMSITIPESVTEFGSAVFFNCEKLISVNIPNCVTSIDNQLFNGCSSLSSITIPENVSYIGDWIFDGCTSLVSIEVKEGNNVYDSRNNCNAIIETSSNTLIAGCQNTTIPNSVTSIKGYAFIGCSSLTSITIPNSVRSIGAEAFRDCSGLTDVYCYAETVPTIVSSAFADTPIRNITLHVPTASINAYKTTAPWSDFKEIVGLDYLNVDELNIKAGESYTLDVDLTNEISNLVGFQMDLTLPEGVGIDKTGCALSPRITDLDQELTIGKLESGAYRITSTSLSLTPISGNDGALFSLKLTAEDGCIGGQATISNIIFSTAESEKVVMSDKTFDISVLYNLTYKVDGQEYKDTSVVYGTALTPEDEPTIEGYTFGGWSELPELMPNHDVEITGCFYLYGDVNTDEDVDVVDVVDIARFVVSTPSVNFSEKLADLNFDNTVNIADAVTLVNHIAGDQNFSREMAPSRESYDYDLCQLQLLSTQENALSLCLDGDADFTAFQFEVELPEYMDITAMRVNGLRMDGHQLLYNKVADNRYRVAVLSLSNAVFKGNEGELLNISIDGLPTNDISIHNVLFVTTKGAGIAFERISLSEATGITAVRVNEGNNVIYDLQGRKLSKVQYGVNIVDGKKVLVNKK